MENNFELTPESVSVSTSTLISDMSSSDSSSSNSYYVSPTSRQKYSLAFKNKVLSYIKQQQVSINHCAKKFEIDRRLISRWLNKKEKIADTYEV
jgi:transposase-like protein